jgi:aspartate ammonia-lyase
MNRKYRIEHDLIGDLEVPQNAYYGVQTVRAMQNFPISGVSLQLYPLFITALAEVKMAAALANHELGDMPDDMKNAIVLACKDIKNGLFHDQFVVDLVQGGAGTSTNMNANEVIANRALEIMGHQKGQYEYCHPNNDVNRSQSTNDAYPTALKIALLKKTEGLIEELKLLIASLHKKAKEFEHIIKIGRTQLQDAVPISLGQSFEAYAVTLEEEIHRLQNNVDLFLEVNMGGTAIGTGINTSPRYTELVVKHLREVTGYPIVKALNLIEATQDTGSFIMYSSAVKRLGIKLSKMCNDLRLISSGPRAGLGEINLPAVQPGSSIMPGKVNPVIPEVVNQIAFKVMGNDLTVNMAVEAGQLELNAFEPIIATSLFESIRLLINGMETLRIRCIDGITANEERCRENVRNSISIITLLNPVLGYAVCTELSSEALKKNRSIYDLVLEKELMDKETLEQLLSPENMIRPQLG